MDDLSALAISMSVFMRDVPDPRSKRAIRHPLVNILTIALCAALCGFTSFEEMEDYGTIQLPFLSTFLRMRHGVPSHDTFRRVFEALNKEAFAEALTSLAMALGAAVVDRERKENRPKVRKAAGKFPHLCIDGKTLRGSLSRKDNTAVHMVNVYAARRGLSLRTMATQGKGKELPATRAVLEKLNLKGVVVSLDALGCQRDIALYIYSRKGHFLLSVKANHAALLDCMKGHFAALSPSLPPEAVFETANRGHGRQEIRKIEVISGLKECMDLDWIGVRQMYKITRTRTVLRTGEVTEETAYGITSMTDQQASAEELLDLVREHWDVENKLHRTLDVIFHEDGCQVRSKTAAANLAVLRQIGLNLIKACPTGSTKIKARKMACSMDHSYLAKVLQSAGLRLNA